MKYLKKFNEHNDYEEYIEGSDKQLPNVSVCVNENHKHYTQKPRPLIAKFFIKREENVKIWVDDFPESKAEDYGGDMDAFRENFVERYEWANPYLYTGATFELGGVTYYLFEYVGDSYAAKEICPYALTDTLDFEGKSFAEDIKSNYSPIVYRLDIDENIYDGRSDDPDSDELLVKYEYIIDKKTIWIDDFPERIAEEEYDGDMEAFKEDFVNNYDRTNLYEYTNNTFELSGETYYLWKGGDSIPIEESVPAYLLTTALTFDGLSLEDNIENTYCPFVYALTRDMDVYESLTGFFDSILVKFKDASHKTKILNTTYNVEMIEIDGVVQDEVISEYEFTEDGEHIVRYKLKEEYNTIIATDMFNGCDMSEFTISNGIVDVLDDAFCYCENLTSITVSKTVDDFSSSFEETNMQKIVVDNRNTKYDSRDNCNAIIETSSNTLCLGCEGTVIPSSVTSISEYAFYKTKINTINIPDNITYIGNNAFENTTYLNYITFDSTTPPTIGLNVFDCDNDYSIYVPDESVNTYKTATNWSVYDHRIFAKGYDFQYFTTVALEDGTISFNIFSSIGTNIITSISYSKDEGKTWITTNNVNDKEENLVIDVSVSEGDNVLWKGSAKQLAYYDESNDEFLNSFFSSDCEFDVMGNVMSLLYGDNFVGEITIQEECCFFGLFCDYYNGEKECLVVNANNLKLPAKTLAKRCYSYMFNGCTLLTTAPELPATTLANGCYSNMFSECASLTSAPQLSATTLTQDCYQSMFEGCTSLTSAPQLPATTLAQDCYGGMFAGCTSLTFAPELPTTTLADYCYNYMFANCTSLISAPELPSTTLAEGCYCYMFTECTNLTSVPELSATTLANYCYQNMFAGCTGLTSAPELPATTLAYGCYNYMFSGCTSLTTAPELPSTTLAEGCYGYMFYDCTSLTSAPQLPATTLASSCYSYMFKGCTSLTTAPELPATTLANHCYNCMFKGCTSLTSAPELSATTLTQSCYINMFEGCTSLTSAPELPATTLTRGCYQSMFKGCTGLTSAPQLPATTLAQDCYYNMFYGCRRLNYIKAMFTTTPSSTYTENWVAGVATNGTFVKNSAAQWNVSGFNGIPNGWTVQTASA